MSFVSYECLKDVFWILGDTKPLFYRKEKPHSYKFLYMFGEFGENKWLQKNKSNSNMDTILVKFVWQTRPIRVNPKFVVYS